MSEANEDAGERTNGDTRSRRTYRIRLLSTADEDDVAISTDKKATPSVTKQRELFVYNTAVIAKLARAVAIPQTGTEKLADNFMGFPRG